MEPPPLGQSLRILSANLKNGAADPDAFANLVAALAVDVLAVQEVSHSQAAPLAELFEHGEIAPDDDYIGMGLLSRYPVEIERVPFIWGFGQTARLSAGHWPQPSAPVELTNLHIAAPHMLRPWPGPYLRWRQSGELRRYLADADARDVFPGASTSEQPQAIQSQSHLAAAQGERNGEREASSNPDCIEGYIREESTIKSSAMAVRAGHGAPARPGPVREVGVTFPGDFPNDSPNGFEKGLEKGVSKSDLRNIRPPARVLLGDFNATPYWPWYARMASQFTDAAVTVASKTGSALRPTWGPRPGDAKLLRIDHGFLRGVDVEAFEVLNVLDSDHSAIVMDLNLPIPS